MYLNDVVSFLENFRTIGDLNKYLINKLDCMNLMNKQSLSELTDIDNFNDVEILSQIVSQSKNFPISDLNLKKGLVGGELVLIGYNELSEQGFSDLEFLPFVKVAIKGAKALLKKKLKAKLKREAKKRLLREVKKRLLREARKRLLREARKRLQREAQKRLRKALQDRLTEQLQKKLTPTAVVPSVAPLVAPSVAPSGVPLVSQQKKYKPNIINLRPVVNKKIADQNIQTSLMLGLPALFLLL